MRAFCPLVGRFHGIPRCWVIHRRRRGGQRGRAPSQHGPFVNVQISHAARGAERLLAFEAHEPALRCNDRADTATQGADGQYGYLFVVNGEPTDEPLVELPAQRVNLAEARYWFLDPESTFGIRGFYSKLGKDGTYLEFKITDAPTSLSDRKTFGEQLGMITVVFYTPQSRAKSGTRSAAGGLMTRPGKARKQRVRMYKHTPIGRQLAVVNIHYVTPEALDKLRDEKKPPVAQ